MNGPTLEELQRRGDAIKKANEVIRKYDVIECFMQLWKDDYYKNIKKNWKNIKQNYTDNQQSDSSIEELILALTYDVTVSPYAGVPIDISVKFYEWIFQEMIRNIQSE